MGVGGWRTRAREVFTEGARRRSDRDAAEDTYLSASEATKARQRFPRRRVATFTDRAAPRTDLTRTTRSFI